MVSRFKAERDKKINDHKNRFFDDMVSAYESPGPLKRYYNKHLKRLIRFNIPKGAKVL